MSSKYRCIYLWSMELLIIYSSSIALHKCGNPKTVALAASCQASLQALSEVLGMVKRYRRKQRMEAKPAKPLDRARGWPCRTVNVGKTW